MKAYIQFDGSQYAESYTIVIRKYRYKKAYKFNLYKHGGIVPSAPQEVFIRAYQFIRRKYPEAEIVADLAVMFSLATFSGTLPPAASRLIRRLEDARLHCGDVRVYLPQEIVEACLAYIQAEMYIELNNLLVEYTSLVNPSEC